VAPDRVFNRSAGTLPAVARAPCPRTFAGETHEKIRRGRRYIPSRLRTSSADIPETRITLFRLLWPDAMVTEERGTFKSLAKNSMQAALALPSTGGAVSATLRASPTSPVRAFFLERGWTLTAKVAPLDVS